MALSLAEIHALAADLRARIDGLWIQRVRGVADEAGALVLRGRLPGHNCALLLSVHPPATRLHLVDPLPAAPETPSAFVMLCRKHLEGSHLIGIEALAGDRIVLLDFRRTDQERRLVAELTGARAALHLLDGEGKVLGGLPTAGRGPAPRQAGEVWSPPPAPAFGESPLRAGWPASGEALHPWIAAQERPGVDTGAHDAPLRLLDRRLRKELKRFRRRVRAIEGDLERIGDADEIRHEADLLQTLRAHVKRGDSEVEALDWRSGQARTILLDPSRSLQEEIDRRYHDARRLERGRGVAEERLLQTLERVEALEALALRVQEASDGDGEADGATRDALEAEATRLLGPIRQANQGATGAGRRGNERRQAWHAFHSRDGFDILVGRGAADNDHLTFHIARGNDLWLHAEDWTGAHVIVRRAKAQEVPPGTLEDAALLAAWFSDGRSDSVVSVRWTERKHVRKAKGLAPGQVYLADTRTVDVRPGDSARLQELLAQGRSR